MEEEGGDRLKLIIGIVVIVVLFVIGFFVLRGLFTKKATPSTQLPSAVQATPTPYNYQNMQVSPTIVPGQTTNGAKSGTTNTTGTTNSQNYYYYQSQSNSQGSQSQDSNSQSQSQTLPNGMTQNQNQ